MGIDLTVHSRLIGCLRGSHGYQNKGPGNKRNHHLPGAHVFVLVWSIGIESRYDSKHKTLYITLHDHNKLYLNNNKT